MCWHRHCQHGENLYACVASITDHVFHTTCRYYANWTEPCWKLQTLNVVTALNATGGSHPSNPAAAAFPSLTGHVSRTVAYRLCFHQFKVWGVWGVQALRKLDGASPRVLPRRRRDSTQRNRQQLSKQPRCCCCCCCCTVCVNITLADWLVPPLYKVTACTFCHSDSLTAFLTSCVSTLHAGTTQTQRSLAWSPAATIQRPHKTL
jgi:hypothetical protein